MIINGFIINPLPNNGGYYIAKSESPKRKGYSSYATAILPCYKKGTSTSYKLVRKEDLKGLIMELLQEMKTDPNKWFRRIIPTLHHKLKKVVHNYSSYLMEQVLMYDKTGSIFDNHRVDLQQVFDILRSISKDEELKDEDLWETIPIRKSSRNAVAIPTLVRTKSQIDFSTHSSENIMPNLPLQELSGVFSLSNL